jgi:uncharacterized phage-associated protein
MSCNHALTLQIYFICLANQANATVSNLKLQKLVYYAQAWHLAIYQMPLFEEDFQAWIHGPVIPELYQRYKHFSWQLIVDCAIPVLDKETLSFLDEVADEYLTCDAYELEQMTQIEAPWNQARAGLPPDASSNAMIEKAWMKEYYSTRVKEDTEDNPEATARHQLLV